MPRIVSVGTALPPFKVSQSSAREFAQSVFSSGNLDLSRLLAVFDSAGIDCRYFCCPVDWFGAVHSNAEKNELYIENSTSLSLSACGRALAAANTWPEQIDYIIYVNSTGIATPSIDARLINLIPLRDDIRRTPVWGLGCAGGAAGISHAYHHLLGHPTERVLVVAAEFCGLTFVADDYSKSNLVATALFGDGVAAVVVVGDQVEVDGLEILSTRSHFFPDSLDVMGWNVVSKGLQVVFARRIPDIVEKSSKSDLAEFLVGHGLTLADMGEFVFHPGGMKVVEAYQKALGLRSEQMDLCRGILRDYGNMSSATILFVLERYLQGRANGGRRGEYALMSALGPGFSSESLLLQG